MHSTDKQAVEQAKNQQNGQPRPTANQQPSAGINPIPSPIVAAAAKVVANTNQQLFNELVFANLVAGFVGAEFTGLGEIATTIVEEAILTLPITTSEFQASLPPGKND
jgi:hypothetical protein